MRTKNPTDDSGVESAPPLFKCSSCEQDYVADDECTCSSCQTDVDRSTILVSSIMPDTKDEQAMFGEGFGNRLVVIAHRLMSQGLLFERDPAA